MIDSPAIYRLPLIGLLFCSTCWSGTVDQVFADRFEPSAALLNCPGAQPMTTETNSQGGTFFQAQGVIDPPGDIDFYSAPISAGEWLLIQTDANQDSDPELIDTVVRRPRKGGNFKPRNPLIFRFAANKSWKHSLPYGRARVESARKQEKLATIRGFIRK